MTFNQAAGATYVDLRALPNGAFVLGILDGSGTFRHVRAARISRTTAVAPASDVARILNAELARAGACLCGWNPSLVSVLQRHLSQRAFKIFISRYESAEPLVSEWAAIYEETSRARTSSRPRGRAVLHARFELAGYRPDWDHAGNAPIAHSDRTQAAATDRLVVAMPKNEERRRLDASRRDCLGLRHLVLRAAAELEKGAAYLDTVYTVRDDGRELSFEIGKASPRLDALLAKYGATSWSHISGCDPGLQTLTTAQNRRRSKALAATARQRDYIVLDGAGQDRRRHRPAEDTRFIIGMPEAEARALARQFGQWAIVTGTADAPAKLVWCLDRGPDPLIVTQLATPPAGF